jgi:hypothetical protein
MDDKKQDPSAQKQVSGSCPAADPSPAAPAERSDWVPWRVGVVKRDHRGASYQQIFGQDGVYVFRRIE